MALPAEVDALIRGYLDRAQAALPAVSATGYLPHDVGLFLSQSIHLLDQLADGLVEAKQMNSSIRAAIQQLEDENDLSEVDSLSSLMQTHSVLRSVRFLGSGRLYPNC